MTSLDPGLRRLLALGRGVRQLGFHPLPCPDSFPDQVSRLYEE